jgi:hypothetical protein
MLTLDGDSGDAVALSGHFIDFFSGIAAEFYTFPQDLLIKRLTRGCLIPFVNVGYEGWELKESTASALTSCHIRHRETPL